MSDLALYITGGLAGVALLLALLSAWLWKALKSYRARVAELHDEVIEVAASSGFGRRVAGFDDDRELSELGGCVNQLIEALHVRDGKARKKEEIFKDTPDCLRCDRCTWTGCFSSWYSTKTTVLVQVVQVRRFFFLDLHTRVGKNSTSTNIQYYFT